MKLDKLVGNRFKEKPADCVLDSHALMLRGGYMKGVANGIYSSYTPLRNITRKIEQIIREEMNAIDGQEVQFPVVMPASLWQQSGRYESVGSELLRFTDRNKSPMLLGMTHEEAAVQLVREYGQTYTKYPFMVYQVQTKFRDEARPRGGLIRVREFTMKDAYSFHTSQEDLEQYYERCFRAYERIFARVGIPEVIAVASDSGMMGGAISHEFILLTPVGEDTIAICRECDYKTNMEAAESIVRNIRDVKSEPLTLVHTPDKHTIDEVCAFLNVPKEKCCKSVVYRQSSDGTLVVLFIRGDLEVNETKLVNFLGCEISPAEISDSDSLISGFIGPYKLNGDFIVLFDNSLENTNNLVCGGNVAEHHYTNLDMQRDLGQVTYHDFAKIIQDGICPKCRKPSISLSRGIEVGNIFQLGTKYTKAMGMQYIGSDGNLHYPVMGCYGIGIGRLAASICEAHRDIYGPVWPLSVAPWQAHICAVRSDTPAVKVFADNLCDDLQSAGVEVVYDDRPVSAGVIFADADLLGVPFRVIVSPRNMDESCCEICSRDKSISVKVPVDTVKDKVIELISNKK